MARGISMSAALKSILLCGLMIGTAQADPIGHGVGGGSSIPIAAKNAGYTINTFHIPQGGFSTSNVDTASTFAPGFQIYSGRFFTTDPPEPFSNYATINPDGSITVGFNDHTAPAFQLATAAQIVGSPPWVGTVFGCGAYITAEVAMPESQAPGSFQAYWYGDAIEQLAYPFGSSQETWPGQATNYSAFVEADFMELIGSNVNTPTGKQSYYTTLHNWYGVYQSTCPSGYCDVNNAGGNGNETYVPKYTDFTQYHRIAFLWVPATAAPTNGNVSFWFDDELVNGPYSYAQFTTQSPPPASPFIFGVIDIRHLALIFGGSLKNQVTLRSMDVWQGSGSCNLTN